MKTIQWQDDLSIGMPRISPDSSYTINLPIVLQGALSGLNLKGKQARIYAIYNTPEAPAPVPEDVSLSDFFLSVAVNLRTENMAELLSIRSISLDALLEAQRELRQEHRREVRPTLLDGAAHVGPDEERVGADVARHLRRDVVARAQRERVADLDARQLLCPRDERSEHIPYLKVNPRVDSLRSEPRFDAILASMNL